MSAGEAMAQGEADPNDRWTRRARPTFLYVMYLLLLWSIPMGLLAGVRPAMAAAMIRGMAQCPPSQSRSTRSSAPAIWAIRSRGNGGSAPVRLSRSGRG